MSLKFEQFVVSRFEYVQCFIAGGMIEGSDSHRALSKKVVDLMSKQLHFVPFIERTAAQRLLAITSSSSLIDTDKQELMCRLNDKVDLEACTDAASLGPSSSVSASSADGSAGSRPAGLAILAATPKKAPKLTQEHKYIHNYGPEQLWAIICNPSASMQTKLSTMAFFLKQIGLRYISEQKQRQRLLPCAGTSV